MLLGLPALLAALWFGRFNPINGYAPSTDSGVYLYIGQQLLRGVVPYRDIFDNKGPLLYAVNALGLLLADGSFWGVYVLEYSLMALTTILTFLILRVRVGWQVAGVVTLFFVLAAAHIAVGNHEEEYAVVLQAVALFLLARKPALETRAWPWFLAGMLGAGAFFLKPTGLGLWIALVVTLLLLCRKTGMWRDAGRQLLVGLAGATTTIVTVLFYLAASGALAAFAADFLTFNLIYVGGHSVAARLHSAVYGAESVGLVVTAAVLLAYALTLRGVLRPRTKDRSVDDLALLAVVWLPVEVALAMTSGNEWLQYYFPWLLPATLLLGLAIRDRGGVWTGATARARRWAARVPVLLLLFALGALLVPTTTVLHALAGSLVHYTAYISVKSDDQRLADYVASRTEPNDYVLVWGDNATINMLAKRRSPTRYVLQLPLYFDAYAPRGVPELLTDLKTHPPVMILDTSVPPFHSPTDPWAAAPIDSPTNPWASSPAPVATAWASVFAYLRQHYRSAGRVDFPPGYRVYVPR